MTYKEIFAGDQTFVNGSRRDEWEKIKWLSCEALIYLSVSQVIHSAFAYHFPTY
jgi:hypothetical protein